MILLSRAEEIILLAIWKLKDDAYGVTIRERILEDTSNDWSFGVIYKTLKKLLDKGFVRKSKSDPLAERGGRSKYFYTITKAGLSSMQEIQKVNSSIWDDVDPLAYDY